MDFFPRLLVATEFPPNAAGGGAAVVRQMLKDWPANRLWWWSCRPDGEALFGRAVAKHFVAEIPQKLYPHRRWRAQKSWLLETLWVPRAARHLTDTLKTVKPDAVWAIPHSWSIPPLARALPGAGIGFHVSLHDYADVPGNVNRLGAERARAMAGMADGLYAGATTRDAICRPMADDLRARTGSDGGINHAGLEPEDFEYLAHPPERPNERLRIAYAGTIIAKESFIVFVNALKQIRGRLPVTLEFFGDHSYRAEDWFDAAWMKEHGNLNAGELSQALRKCDWSFVPMELTDENARYNRFSLPTKFVSYLAAGLPVITLGHPESTVAKMMSEYRVGMSITNEDVQKAGAELLAALPEPNAKAKYRGEILGCARAEFDAERMRAVLYGNLQKCAAVGGQKT